MDSIVYKALTAGNKITFTVRNEVDLITPPDFLPFQGKEIVVAIKLDKLEPKVALALELFLGQNAHTFLVNLQKTPLCAEKIILRNRGFELWFAKGVTSIELFRTLTHALSDAYGRTVVSYV